MIRVELTRQAMLDLREIEEYSIENFGQKAAGQYIDDIEAALVMIQQRPDLLNAKQEIPCFFQFYRVRKHYLVCARGKNLIIILTIKHCQMDLPERLLELEPGLLHEAELLYKTLFKE